MELIVCLKQVVDLQQIRVKKETREPVTEGLPFVFGDMDKNALEEAVRIKEKAGGRVTALSVGSPKLRDTIKEALAAGADQAFIIVDPQFDNLDAGPKAKILAKAIQKIGQFDLILLGEGSADNYSGQAGPRLAELLDRPLVSYVKQLELTDGRVKAVRNVEQYFEVVETQLPAVVTVTSGINQPRIPSLAQILRASRKPLTEWKIADIGMSAEELAEKEVLMVSNLAPVEQRKMVVFEGDQDENINNLVNSLIKEGVLGG